MLNSLVSSAVARTGPESCSRHTGLSHSQHNAEKNEWEECGQKPVTEISGYQLTRCSEHTGYAPSPGRNSQTGFEFRIQGQLVSVLDKTRQGSMRDCQCPG